MSGETMVTVSVEVVVFFLVLSPVSLVVVSSVVLTEAVRSVVSFDALVTMCLSTAASVLGCVASVLLFLLLGRSRSAGLSVVRSGEAGAGLGVRLLGGVADGLTFAPTITTSKGTPVLRLVPSVTSDVAMGHVQMAWWVWVLGEVGVLAAVLSEVLRSVVRQQVLCGIRDALAVSPTPTEVAIAGGDDFSVAQLSLYQPAAEEDPAVGGFLATRQHDLVITLTAVRPWRSPAPPRTPPTPVTAWTPWAGCCPAASRGR
ncbi:hypothetical protein [Streptomyces ossamyceticus]|uniref:hypothetical protein n=2 Tax=Streptomyces ossamyceticus TaxID=249581 RepID=UPI0012FEE917